MLAPEMFAFLKSALIKSTPYKFAPAKFVPMQLESERFAPAILTFEKSMQLKLMSAQFNIMIAFAAACSTVASSFDASMMLNKSY